MINKMPKLLVAFAVVFGTAATFSAPAGAEWKVRRQALSCVVNHLNVYLERRTPAIIINMEDCPPADRVAPLPRVMKGTGGPVDNAIVYSKKQLSCLKSYLQSNPPAGDIVTLPDTLCQ